MSAKVIAFPDKSECPGALSIVREFFDNVQPVREAHRGGAADQLADADYFLAWLYERGFVVTPLT